ncbi:MAG: M56 family metallopeptidase, partial [Lachnospiraceae bacterium]|nr:M56 family metallopeptidase [Lachnospiraceae bacterium]
MMSVLEAAFIKILNMSLTAGIVICIVLLMRFLLRRTPKIFSYILWIVVLFRLLCPVSFSSAMSLFNILRMPSAQQGEIAHIPENIGYMEQPALNLPIPAIENAVNGSLPPASVEASVNPMQIVLWLGGCIWLSGIIIMTLYSVFSYWKLRGKLKEAVWEEDNIYITEAIETPFVCGFYAPHIYLPVQFASDKLSETEQREKRYILLHEQIHIKRRDYIWRFAGYFALCIHWFNPLVWLAFFLSGKDMEMSCDEAVVRMLGENVKKEYSASLLSFASGKRIRPGIPLAFGEGETGSRIKNVLRYKKPAQAAIGIAIVICVAVIAALAANPRNADGESRADGVAGSDSADNAGGIDSEDDLSGEVYYGVVSYVEMEGPPREVVVIPGLGEVEIPEADEVYPYIEIENFTKPEKGDLLAITFPGGEEVSIQETYPAMFSIPAQSIAVMGQGFDIQRTDSGTYIFTVPWGYAQEAEEGDLLVIYYYNDIVADGGVRTQLAAVPVLSVDAVNYDVWVELSADEVRTFLANFGHGIECEIIDNVPNELTFDDIMGGSAVNGICRVYVRSLSRSARGIDLYLTEG